MTFPKDLPWGAASYSCQIEGHAALAGCGPSVRDERVLPEVHHALPGTMRRLDPAWWHEEAAK